MSHRQKTLHGPGGVRLVLDRDQVFPDDPGNGTPAMVELGDANATYTCATNEGVVHGTGRDYGEYPLSDAQLRWLHAQEGLVSDFLGW